MPHMYTAAFSSVVESSPIHHAVTITQQRVCAAEWFWCVELERKAVAWEAALPPLASQARVLARKTKGSCIEGAQNINLMFWSILIAAEQQILNSGGGDGFAGRAWVAACHQLSDVL